MIDPADWTPAAEYILEPNAVSAVTETERNVLAVAGPGAGKTELLAQRADFLLRTTVCPYPRRILAISFKTDAAENLRKRVTERCGADLARRLDSHTFHAFRSEEHTSELQSLMRISYAVFCLKKKNKEVDLQLELTVLQILPTYKNAIYLPPHIHN